VNGHSMQRLLIANRGEIVGRVVRTARRLGVTTIAVYSDADRDARHVRIADEAYHLGESPPAMSYLNIARIIALAKCVRADAIHPGYGFLSENAEFAAACAETGLVFIGPPAAAIRAMGSKSASKAAMAAVGVPIAPGYHGEDQRLEQLEAEAARVGYPLIIKASAGGGGKGMQVVSSGAEVAAAVASAQRLARTAFGDGRLLLERYFPRARHVEVQVFADLEGQVVTLFDRDCSVQRRHQKIVEEAPAPGLRPEVRAAMAAAAITAARSVGYVGAGTVEFLVDEHQDFYFMEMNTRLQVEHPVTELITGIDLVEWQIRVARGEPLPRTAAALEACGAAVEVRLYAEDPARDFLPSVGRIDHLTWPDAALGLRLDVGVDRGDEVSPFYDPMLGKMIAWGESRAQAIDTLRQALEGLEVGGVATNRDLLDSILADPEFRDANVATDFLTVRRPFLAFAVPAPSDDDFFIAAAWCATRGTAATGPWEDTRGWRLGTPPTSSWRFGERRVRVTMVGEQEYVVRLDDHAASLIMVARTAQSLDVELDGTRHRVTVIESTGEISLFERGRQRRLRLCVTDDALQAVAGGEEGSLKTPLPGTVVAVHVAAGEHVARGAPLVTVEAMKMEHTLTAPHAGVIERVLFATSDRVAAGAVLVELTPSRP